MKRKVLTLFVLALAFMSAKLAFTYSQSAPPPARTNAPGETNCTDCHNSFALATSGSVWNNITLTSSVPLASFVAGNTYTLQLSVANPASVKYGFELVALPSGATFSSGNIGTLSSTNNQTALQSSGNRNYISHSSLGTAAASRARSWSFNWTAPSTFSGVDFYVVVNNTNNDGTNQGDQVFAKVFSANVLPVKWLSYQVKAQRAGNLLTWSTASEFNNDHFNIERSGDGRTWTDVGTVKSQGNHSLRSDYEYFDIAAAPASYYRIKQVDADGRADYSKVLYAGNASPDETVSYDPLVSKISIVNPALMSPATLYNLSGIAVKEDMYGRSIDVSDLDKGIYLLKLPSGLLQKIYIY